ncbi:MAG: HlyD family secretion protein [Bacteroidales bacterium]|nr:HlyD family secretion protein [Bacteroidales bacterium]
MDGETSQAGAASVKNKRNIYLEVAATVLLAAGTLWILSLIFNFSRHIRTNNAQVDGDLVAVTSRISGIIKETRFESYDVIKAGDTIVRIDDEEFRIKVQQAEADLETAITGLHIAEQNVITARSHEAAAKAKLQGNTASLERAEKNYQRYQNMYADSAVTRNQFDQVIAQWKTDQAYLEAGEKELLASRSVTEQNIRNIASAKATVKRKEADLEAARLQLSYTVMTAPVNGVAGERTIFTGELVHANQMMVDIVPQDRKWVTANFKETQLKDLKIGQEVVIEVDALGGKRYTGKVKNLSPATGAKFSMVAPDNSTGNFVKITQRIPVNIEFDDLPDKLHEVRPGMNVTVTIKK